LRHHFTILFAWSFAASLPDRHAADREIDTDPKIFSRGRSREDRMRAKRVMTNLRVPDIEEAKTFYADFLGLSTEELNLGWVAASPRPTAGPTSSSSRATPRRPRTLRAPDGNIVHHPN
jgi:hypothetical protein